MFKKMRRKLTAMYAMIMAVVFVLMVIGIHKSMVWSVNSEQEHEILLYAKEEAIEHVMLLKHKNMLKLDGEDEKGRMYFYVYDLEGKLISATRAKKPIEDVVLHRIENWQIEDGEVISLKVGGENLMMASLPIEEDGQLLGKVYVGRNVTSALRIQQQITIILSIFSFVALILAVIVGHIMSGRAIVPLKRAYEKQRQFTADASHELRTPLSIVMMSTEILQSSEEVKSSFLQQTLVDMKDEILKMTKLVSDLLTIARNDHDTVQILKQKFDLDEIVCQTLRKIKPLADEKNIELQFVDDSHLMRGDIERIKQLILILVDNAVKYTAFGGKVQISIVVCQNGKKVRLCVEDNGSGIAPEDIKHVFDRFYRADKARTRTNGGTGLGLAIAKGIVELHDGEIEVESELGKGSRFIVVMNV